MYCVSNAGYNPGYVSLFPSLLFLLFAFLGTKGLSSFFLLLQDGHNNRSGEDEPREDHACGHEKGVVLGVVEFPLYFIFLGETLLCCACARPCGGGGGGGGGGGSSLQLAARKDWLNSEPPTVLTCTDFRGKILKVCTEVLKFGL